MMFKEKLKSRIVEPAKFHKDLDHFYLSDYLIRELREYYTIHELSAYYSSRPSDPATRCSCKQNWPICYLALEKAKNHQHSHMQLFTTQYILSNFKGDHYIEKRSQRKKTQEEKSEIVVQQQKIEEKDLLIERQRHVCECRDHKFDRMKSEIRDRISKMLANPNYVKSPPISKSQIDKQGSSEVNQVYSDFMRNRGKTLTIPEEHSDYSQSIGSKPSHEITHFDNTCKSGRPSIPD